MGRAGAGGSRGSSGGGHSSSRSGGGHRVGSSSRSGGSRAGAGSRSMGGGSFGGSGSRRTSPPPPPRRTPPPPRGGFHGGPGMPPPPPRGGFHGGPGMPPPPPPRRGYQYRSGGSSGGGCLTSILLVLIVLVVLGVFINQNGGTGNIPSSRQESTIVRNKLEATTGYINDCIIDEIGWFDNISKTETRLKEFWEETGVQPYIILKSHDASLTTDEAKEQWTLDYYDANFTAENIFLFVYFAEEDTDNDVGYMCYAGGMQTSSVMDAEAVDIFWGNIDEYWYTDLSTDDVFVRAFTETAETIMHMPTTGKDVMKSGLIVVAVVAAGVIIIILVNKRNKRKKEEAEERQRILDTPIHDMAADNLTDKYTKQ